MIIGRWLNKGSLLDLYGGNNGVLTSGSSRGFIKSSRGLCMEFDNANTRVDTGSDVIGIGANSTFAWIFLNGWGEGNSVIEGFIVSNGEFTFQVGGAGDKLFFTGDGFTSISSPNNSLSLGKWFHVGITRNSDGLATNFYIDGVLSGTADQNSGTPEAGSTNVIIGATSAGYYTFDGYIQDVRIYDEVLSAQEVAQIYNDTKDGFHSVQTKRGLVYPEPTDLSNETGLVFASNMKAQDGEVVDISGEGNNGTIHGALDTKGVFDRALMFPVDSYVNFGDVLDVGADNFSFSFWFKPVQRGTQERLISKGLYYGAHYELHYRGSGGVDLGFRGPISGLTDVESNDLLTLNEWTHIAITVDRGNEFRMFFNGTEVSYLAQSVPHSDNLDNSEDMLFGSASNQDMLNSSLDEVRMYNKVLSEQEIKDEYNKGAEQVLFIDNNSDAPADGITQSSALGSYRIESGTFRYSEDSTGKYIDCVTNGVISDSYGVDGSTGNGWVKTATGDLSGDEGDTVDNSTAFAVSGGRLSITMTAGDKLRILVITRGEKLEGD